MASNLVSAPTDTTIVDHLQRFHGIDVAGEWEWASDDHRRNVLNSVALLERHVMQHEHQHWNEASDYHKHPRLWAALDHPMPDDSDA